MTYSVLEKHAFGRRSSPVYRPEPERCGAITNAGKPCRNTKNGCNFHRPGKSPGARLLKLLDKLDEGDQLQLLAAISDLIEPARKAIKRGEPDKALAVLDPLVFHMSGEG